MHIITAVLSAVRLCGKSLQHTHINIRHIHYIPFSSTQEEDVSAPVPRIDHRYDMIWIHATRLVTVVDIIWIHTTRLITVVDACPVVLIYFVTEG